MFLTRRRNFQIFGKRKQGFYDSYLDSDSSNSTEDLLWDNPEDDDDSQDPLSASKNLPKRRTCCGLIINTPNSSRFSDHIHSRILQKFPFLIEMFYWIITYLFYRSTKVISQKIFTKSIIEVAQAHGLAILEFEQFSWASFLFPIKEHSVQHWFLEGHQNALTVLNRAYALIHIPGTVGFVASLPRLLNTPPPFAPNILSYRQQFYSMVLLHCALTSDLRHNPPHPHPYQPLRLPNLYPLPLHASAPAPAGVWLPGLGAPRQRNLDMDERQLCQLSRRHAQYALRLCLRDRLHHDLPRRYLQEDPGAGGDGKVGFLEIRVLSHRAGIPEHDSRHHCGNGESLLAGRADGDDRGLRRLFI